MIDYPIERQLEFACLERDEAQARVAALTAALEKARYYLVSGAPLTQPERMLLDEIDAALDAAGGA